MARGVSSPAGDDKGSSPLTSAAFLKNCCTKKLLFLLLPKIYLRISLDPCQMTDSPFGIPIQVNPVGNQKRKVP
jgi:hypothetical protein